VLGDGGPRHQATLQALVDAGANVDLPDRNGQTPLALARSRGYERMAEILRKAPARWRVFVSAYGRVPVVAPSA
jgi:ankyrin repeat protein